MALFEGPRGLPHAVSLWELVMNLLNAKRLASLASHLENTCQQAQSHADGNCTQAHRDLLMRNLEAIDDDLAEIGLESPRDQVLRARTLLQRDGDVKHNEIGMAFKELNARFEDELGHQLCFVVPRKNSHLYDQPNLFGIEVSEAFPSAIVDIEEAGKSLALQRGTATVFHLMRVVEAGLKAVAAALDIAYAPSWESYLKQIGKELEKDWKDKSRSWRKQEPFFREVQVHLFAVKVAWRNPTMHIVQHYTPDMAEEVYHAVRGFMRHLATNLSEKKPRRRAAKKVASGK